jgi:hypothetical protein
LSKLYLNKTSGTTVSQKPVKDTAAKTPPLQTPKPPVSSAAPRSISSLIAAAGLPADKLSASIISFARFFSLPLKPELMAAIRRQAFSLPSAEADSLKQAAADVSQPAVAAKPREAFSLAAAAAESKGVELQSKALESFAEAIDPEWQERHDSGGQNRRQQNRKQHEQKDESEPSKPNPISALRLEKMALEYAEKNPLLSMLNRLPDKNGQRWIVLPFDFCEDGRNFRVSMRVLLEAEHVNKNVLSNRSVFMPLDIFKTGISEKRFSFALEAANNKISRVSIFVQPDFPSSVHSLFKREISVLLEIPPEHVSVKVRPDSFPFESSCGDELLRSIDEAV